MDNWADEIKGMTKHEFSEHMKKYDEQDPNRTPRIALLLLFPLLNHITITSSSSWVSLSLNKLLESLDHFVRRDYQEFVAVSQDPLPVRQYQPIVFV